MFTIFDPTSHHHSANKIAFLKKKVQEVIKVVPEASQANADSGKNG
jgi:hypothetical protein